MVTNAHAMWERHREEYLKFDRIPESERRHPRPDLCAMLYLHERFGGGGDAVCSASHDEIWLDWDDSCVFTEEDAIYLYRCGVRHQDDGLCMFV